MNIYVYKSGIGSYIESFIAQKRNTGYPYESSARILYRFDGFVADKYSNADMLKKDICMGWVFLKDGEHPNGLIRRTTPVRQLGKYLCGLGYDAYVIPGHIPNKQIHYVSHIYTQQELTAFFKAVDSCPPSPFSPARCYVIPVIFRIIYCCGLRLSEARLLQCKDVDLNTGRIVIRESKGWSMRIVFMSADLLEVCREYNSLVSTMLPDREAFFPNKDGQFYSRNTLDCWFHEFWDPLPEAGQLKGNPARVHAFRHTYAVNRLNQWVKEGQNIQSLYLYLSQYMGHAKFTDTDYYLSLTEEFYPELESRMAQINKEILPEVCYDREE